MLADFYLHLKEYLLALPGMQVVDLGTKPGYGAPDSSEMFYLHGRAFVTLRLTGQFIVVYAAQVLAQPALADYVGPALRAQFWGKSCFKLATPQQVDQRELEALFAAAARQWTA